MGRYLKCLRLLTFFGKVFEQGERYDIDQFAAELKKDPDWLWAKMSTYHMQTGRVQVPCFAVVEGGGEAGEEETPRDAEPPSGSVSEEEQEASSYPQDKLGGWWLLSDGSTLRGRRKARKAQAALETETDTT